MIEGRPVHRLSTLIEPVLNNPLPDRSLDEQLPFRTKPVPSHHWVLQILSNPEGLCASGGPYILPELGPSAGQHDTNCLDFRAVLCELLTLT